MSRSDWDREPPPLEAYSRITNPERFAPLHERARALVEQLVRDYDVRTTEAFTLLPRMRPFEHASAPVTLAPADPGSAPIAIAFTAFPSLVVRCGHWLADSFPSCGCDACRETAGTEWERLERLVAHVVAGEFQEALTIPWLGEARLRWALGDIDGHATRHSSGVRVLRRRDARALLGRGPARVQWRPWPRRGPTLDTGRR